MNDETFKKLGVGIVAHAIAFLSVAGVPVGQSHVVGDLMWSDTFTVGSRCASGYYSNVGGSNTRVDSAYMVEHAVGATQWRRPKDFSFNTPADAVSQYSQNNTGNDGALTGFAQSGGGVVSFRGMLPSRVAFQMDARATCASLSIATYSTELPDAASSFQVKFYGTGTVKLAAYGAAEIDTGLTTGLTSLNTQWHNYAVIFDRGEQSVEVFVDEVSRGTVDLGPLGVTMKADDPCIGMGCAGYVAWYDNVQAGVPATGGNDLALEAWRTERMNVGTSSRRAPILADGTVVKTGTGTLDLGGAAIARGTLNVREGAAGIDATDPGLPVQLQTGLAFWVDANVNVTTVGGKVTEWRDRREASGGQLYPRAVAHGTGEEPTLVDGTGSAAGRKLVDFGTFGQSDAGWLRWEDADGNRRPTNVVYAIYVLACPNGGGCVIGDWDGATDDVHTGNAGWNPELLPETSSLVGARFSTSSYTAFVDDVACNSINVTFATDLTVYALTRGNNNLASTFFNDRNLRQGDAGDTNGTPCAVSHQGGGRLAEALLFSRDLHETECRMINAYLMRKWKGGVSIGHAHLAKNTTLQVPAGTLRPPVLGTLTGAGHVAITGTVGSVRLAAGLAPRLTTPIDLSLGTSLVADEEVHVGYFPAVVRTGRSYSVTPSGMAATACGDATCAEKTGTGTLVASALPTGTVRVAAGALRLTAQVDEKPVTNLIANADFENVTSFQANGTVSSQVTWGYNSTVPCWTLGSLTGSSVTAGAASCPGSTFSGPYKTSSGQTALFIQTDGYAETTFSVPAPGRYRLDFTAFKRNWGGSPFGLLDVLLDGVSVGRIQINRTGPRTFSLAFPTPLGAGSHTLRFQGVLVPSATNPENNLDTMALIDDVRVTEDRLRLGENLVVNGGFETHDPLLQTVDNAYLPFQYAPTGAGWLFIDPANPSVTNAGITQAEGAWTYYQAPEGTCMAFLRQTGYFAQDITFPAPGRYQLSFVMRGRFLNANSWNFVGQTFKVFLGETQVAYLQGSIWEPERVTVELPAIDAEHLTQRLSFRGQATRDASTMFDDIRVERLPGGLVNPSFEWAGTFANGSWEAGIQGAGWSFDVGANERNQSGISLRSGPWANGAGVPFGDCCAFIQQRGRIAQTVTVSQDGVYEVSFSTKRRTVFYANHDFRLVCAGMVLGAVTTRPQDDWKRYTFHTPVLKAGVPFELAFEGLNRGDNTDRASLIDEVSLRRVADGGTPSPAAFAGASLELSDGAALELDFDGMVELKDLSYAGHRWCGELNASNCPFIRGTGTVYVRSNGLTVIIR